MEVFQKELENMCVYDRGEKTTNMNSDVSM